MADFITDLVSDIIAGRNALEEMVCESAVQGGLHGVIVIEGGIGLHSVEVSPLVPYGNLLRFPSVEAVERWKENGCPL